MIRKDEITSRAATWMELELFIGSMQREKDKHCMVVLSSDLQRSQTREWKIPNDNKPLALDYRTENAKEIGGGNNDWK